MANSTISVTTDEIKELQGAIKKLGSTGMSKLSDALGSLKGLFDSLGIELNTSQKKMLEVGKATTKMISSLEKLGGVDVGKALTKQFKKFKKNFMDGNDGLTAAAKQQWESLKSTVDIQWRYLKTTVGAQWNKMIDGAANLGRNIKNSLQDLPNTLKAQWGNFKNAVKQQWNELKNGAVVLGNKIKTNIKNLPATMKKQWDKFTEALSEQWNKLKQAAIDLGKNIKEKVRNLLIGKKGMKDTAAETKKATKATDSKTASSKKATAANKEQAASSKKATAANKDQAVSSKKVAAADKDQATATKKSTAAIKDKNIAQKKATGLGKAGAAATKKQAGANKGLIGTLLGVKGALKASNIVKGISIVLKGIMKIAMAAIGILAFTAAISALISLGPRIIGFFTGANRAAREHEREVARLADQYDVSTEQIESDIERMGEALEGMEKSSTEVWSEINSAAQNAANIFGGCADEIRGEIADLVAYYGTYEEAIASWEATQMEALEEVASEWGVTAYEIKDALGDIDLEEWVAKQEEQLGELSDAWNVSASDIQAALQEYNISMDEKETLNIIPYKGDNVDMFQNLLIQRFARKFYK